MPDRPHDTFDEVVEWFKTIDPTETPSVHGVQTPEWAALVAVNNRDRTVAFRSADGSRWYTRGWVA